MKGTNCTFSFDPIDLLEVKKLEMCKKDSKQFGLDYLDGKIISIMAEYIVKPVCHISNLSLKERLFPKIWKMAKVVPLPKDNKLVLSGTNSRPISILPILSKIMENLIFAQISHYEF